jgi:hypothetical protein
VISSKECGTPGEPSFFAAALGVALLPNGQSFYVESQLLLALLWSLT